MDLTTKADGKLPLKPGEFRFITKAMAIEPSPEGQPGPRRFKMIASSTIVDDGKDEIKMSALQDLEATYRRGRNVFTDHEHKVRNVFGRTDHAQIMASGEIDPKTKQPIYDLHVAGVVNEPNPDMVQLADSIDGGYVTFGASIGAVVTEHKRNKDGGMDIYHLDGKELSMVGIPMNQRSWTYKAAKAAKALDALVEEDDDMDDPITEPVAEAKAADEPQIEKTDGCPTCGCAADEGGDCANAYHPTSKELDTSILTGIDKVTTEETTIETTPDGQESDGQAADPAATETASDDPETASDDEESAEADLAPDGEKKTAAFDPADVAELATKTVRLAEMIVKRDETIAAQNEAIANLTSENRRLTEENEAAGRVIERVMKLPLRRKAQDHVSSFEDRYPSFVSKDVQKYLNSAGDTE